MASRSASSHPSPGVFSVDASGEGLSYTQGVVDPKNYVEIDMAIRNLKCVREALEIKAEMVRQGTGFPEHYEVVMSTKGKSSPRAYLVPIDSEGIRLELSQAVVTVAALSAIGR
jgi:hypothetical protein